MALKENVLRKNLLTKEIDRGQVDTEFEQENLRGNIIKDYPFIEITEEDSDYQTMFFSREKEKRLLLIKQEANQRISNVYPDYKQRNLTAAVCFIHNKEILAYKTGQIYELTADEKATIAKAAACNDFILFIRNKSNALEKVLNDCTTSAELLNIDISSDNYWL
jgi:hypothetical protein